MATNVWKGSAVKVAKVNTFLFAGTIEADDVIRVTIGSKSKDFTTGSTVAATVVSTLVTAWLALDQNVYPEFFEMTPNASTATLVLTAVTAGVDFTVTLTPLEANLSAADAQTIEGGGVATTGTIATASAGPNHYDTASNWSLGAVPVSTNDVFIDGSVDILYGLSQSGVTLATLNIALSYTGKIGLPDYNESFGYYEYRQKDLLAPATICNIGQGEGSGSGRINWDASSVATTLNVFGTGSPIGQGTKALMFKGTSASNILNAYKGSIGVALRPGETANLSGGVNVGSEDNPASDVDLRLGSGTTLTTLKTHGGVIEVNSNHTTVNMYGGVITILGASTTTTLNGEAGVFYDLSTGTMTNLNVGTGFTYDAGRIISAKTITTPTIQVGGVYRDSNKRVTWSTAIVYGHGATLKNVDMDIGYNFSLQRS